MSEFLKKLHEADSEICFPQMRESDEPECADLSKYTLMTAICIPGLLSTILKCVDRLINLRTIRIIFNDKTNVKDVEFVVPVIIEDIESEPDIHLDLHKIDRERGIALIPSHRLTSLKMAYTFTAEPSFEQVMNDLETKTRLETLIIDIDTSLNVSEQRNNPPIQEFLQFFAPQKLTSLRKLTLNFDKFQVISNKELVQFANLLSEPTVQLEGLSINFQSAKLQAKGCEDFFSTLANHSKYSLKSFAFKADLAFSENIVKAIARFLNQSPTIEAIDFSEFQAPVKVLQSFLDSQSKFDHLTSFTCGLLKNSIKDAGLLPISEFLSKLPSPLRAIKLEFNSKNFSDESLLRLGSVFTKIETLNDLSLKFTGVILDYQVQELGRAIAQCTKLQALFIDFSIPFHNQVVDLKADSSDTTIFEKNSIDISAVRTFTVQSPPVGYFYCYLIKLILGIENTRSNHVSIEYPFIGSTGEALVAKVFEEFQRFTGSRKTLRSLQIVNQAERYQDMQTLYPVFDQNISTLTRLDIQGKLWDDIIQKFTALKDNNNILSFSRTGKSQEEEEVQYDYFEYFPNLIQFEFKYFSPQRQRPQVFSGKYIINSNLTRLSHFQEVVTNETEVYRECIKTRFSTILSLQVFEKQINSNLTVNPKLITYDLWID